MAAVWALEIACTEKFVLLALADNANDDGSCWPSIDTLATKTSLSTRTVRYALKRLSETGHLAIKQRFGSSNVFHVTPARGAALHPMQDAPDAPTPATGAGSGLHVVQGTPARGAPRTIKEPSVEPSRNQESALTRASRLPEDFILTPERKAVAEKEGVDAERTFATFVDYWRAASGGKARKHDWDATWRNWCRRQSDTTRAPARKTRFAQAMEVLNRA